MNKKLICALLFLALSVPYAAFAESDEDATDAAEETEAATEVETEAAADDASAEADVAEAEAEADTAPELESGSGWKTVRVAELGKSGKKVYMVLVEQNRHTDKTLYSNAISRLCQGEEEFCRVRFWSNERFIPERVAMTAEQNKQLKVDYLLNKTAGIRELRWSCGIDPNSQNCLPN